MASTPPANFRDDIVIIVTLVGCFVCAVLLRLNRDDIEPIFITLFLGVAVAALTYRYLGGTDGSTFQIAALKLGGSAALLAGITFLVSEVMENQREWIKSDEEYRVELAKETKEATRQLRLDHEAQIKDIRDQNETAIRALESDVENSETRVLAKLRDPKNTALIGRVLEIFRSPTGPLTFASLTTAKAINNGSIRQRNSVWLCQKHISDIFGDGIVGNEIAVRANGREPFNVRLLGTIGGSACASDKFSMQLHCDVSKKLFPEFITECSGNVPRVSPAKVDSLNEEGQLVLPVSLGRRIDSFAN